MKKFFSYYALIAAAANDMSFGKGRRQRDNAGLPQRFYPCKYNKAKIHGATLYEYPDGFSCYALNKKNADRKHNKFLQNTSTM